MTGLSKGHAQRAYDGIRNMLFHNDIGPGQKISYRDLAERLGMSQTPVIQALKWLELQQLVRREPNRGYYTASISKREVEEIYDLRLLIERDLLKRTMARTDAVELAPLRASLAAHLAAARADYLYERLQTDMAFHLVMAEMAGCAVHLQSLKNLFDLLYLKYGGKFLFTSPVAQADADHRALVDRMAAGDTRSAMHILTRHLRRVKQHVLRNVEKTLSVPRVPTQ